MVEVVIFSNLISSFIPCHSPRVHLLVQCMDCLKQCTFRVAQGTAWEWVSLPVRRTDLVSRPPCERVNWCGSGGGRYGPSIYLWPSCFAPVRRATGINAAPWFPIRIARTRGPVPPAAFICPQGDGSLLRPAALISHNANTPRVRGMEEIPRGDSGGFHFLFCMLCPLCFSRSCAFGFGSSFPALHWGWIGIICNHIFIHNRPCFAQKAKG